MGREYGKTGGGWARPLAVVLAFSACGGAAAPAKQVAPGPPAVGPEAAAQAITAKRILGHIQVLASDAFEGRAPGSAGEEKAVAYIQGAFAGLGLQPGNTDGTWVQEVPLAGVTSHATVTATTTAGAHAVPLAMPDDVVIGPRGAVTETHVDSDVVFCGYGVVAPEYGWDDFKGADVRGKTLVVLVNDPPVTGAFEGRAMTYYGRYTYKYEEAERKGAAAVLVVHETEAASYPWQVVTASWGRENFKIPEPGGESKMVEGWISLEAARRLFAATGHDYDAAKASAARRDFAPVSLGARAKIDVASTLRTVTSKNVLAWLPGSDARVAAEHVIYTAHWDHLGRDEAQRPDPIYNGAVDNASGVATMLEIARAFSLLRPAPRRSILFLAVTAEERGLLGSEYYASHPVHRIEDALADVNMDSMNVWGKTGSVADIGYGQSSLDDVLRAEAAQQGRTIVGDRTPEAGAFFRSDHFSFVKHGVPSLHVRGGDDYLGRPPSWGAAKEQDFRAHDYHHPSDEVKPGWDLSGAAEDARLFFRVGLRVAETDARPTFASGSPFARRNQP